jgi:hypothetical protein
MVRKQGTVLNEHLAREVLLGLAVVWSYVGKWE